MAKKAKQSDTAAGTPEAIARDFEEASRYVLEALREIEKNIQAIREELVLEMARERVHPEDTSRKQFDALKATLEALEVNFTKRGDARGGMPRLPP